MMRQRATRAVLLAGILAGGCQKETAGGGAGGAGGGLDFPSDTAAVIGFVRKGPAPSAADLTAALTELASEKPDREMAELIDACIAPVGAHLERTTVALRGSVNDENVVAWASGPGLRPALEACFTAMAGKRDKPFAPTQDGDYTVYPLGGEPIIARWTGTDQVVLASSKDRVDSAMKAAGGLKGTPLEKAMAEVDRSGSVWFAAAGPGLPEQAELEWAAGSVKDLHGSVRAVFKSPEAAKQAAGMAQMVIPKGVKIEGSEVKIGVNVVDLPTLIPGKPGKPLSAEHARALLDAGPLVFGLVMFSGGESRPATAEPAVVEPAPPVPEPVPAPAAPAPPAAPTPP